MGNNNLSRHNIVFDLEATCWDVKGNDSATEEDILKQASDMEVIQIGAYKVHWKTFEVLDEFNVYVKPVIHPNLSDFCTNLTGITDDLLNEEGITYKEAYESFIEWSNNPRGYIGWGPLDHGLLHRDCRRNNIRVFPRGRYINGKNLYLYWTGYRPNGLSKCVKRTNTDFEGRAHNALADAKMTVHVLREAWLDF